MNIQSLILLLDYFREDPDFVEHEAQFEEIKKTIVGEVHDSGLTIMY